MHPASALPRGAVDRTVEELATTAAPIAQLIVETYLPRIHRFAAMVSPPGTSADDLTQEACVRAIERAQQFDPNRGALDAWLWRIVVNLARDAGRASRRSELLTARLMQRHRTAASASPETLALEHLRSGDLLAAVRRLPRRHRTVIALRYGAGLTTVEIAECLGTTRMATAKALRRALDRLRADLAEPEDQR